MGRIRIRNYQSISVVNDSDWSRLARQSAFTSLAWLRTIESCGVWPVRPQLLLAYADGNPQGAMVLEFVEDKERQNGVARTVLGGNRGRLGLLGNRFVPNLAAGVPHGYGGQLFFADSGDVDLQVEVAKGLISAAEALSTRLRAPLWFTNVSASDKLLLTTLRRAGYLSARYLPLAELAIEWQSFDEYVQWLKGRSHNVAKDIRRERNRCLAAGITFEEPADVNRLDSHFVDMANQTYRQHGDQVFPFASGFFTSLQRQLRESFLVCTARKDDEVLGFVTMLSDGETAWADSYGLDYSHPDHAFIYFNLVFQWPVRKAIQQGLKRIVFGRGQYKLKARRGCSLSESYLLYKPKGWFTRGLYAGLFRMLDSHYARQVPPGSNI